jgi:hypothetical protein
VDDPRDVDAEAPQSVGWFRFHFADQRWEWSPEVQIMHGYRPGTVTPTTELVLDHKHPADRQQVAAQIDGILTTHEPFSTSHRICDTAGNIHRVLVVGDVMRDDGGEVVGTHGFYIDLTANPEQAAEDHIAAKVAEFAEWRGLIEQAKGMLMLVYDIDSDDAFALLKTLSQDNNIKLRLIAKRLCDEFRARGRNAGSRHDFDRLVLDVRAAMTSRALSGSTATLSAEGGSPGRATE